MTKSQNINKPRFKWTDKNLQVLKTRYPFCTTQELANFLGTSMAVVWAKSSRLNLKKDPCYLLLGKSGRIEHGKQPIKSVETQFKKGHLPLNKGAKGWQAGGRSVETRFKKGQNPMNTMPVGAYRIVTFKNGMQYVEQKFSDARGAPNKRWKVVHRAVWEQHYGSIPPGHVVTFKNGMHTIEPEKITIDVLDCITLAENMKRNSILLLPKNLQEIIKINGQIKRAINNRSKTA
jgi:hypothetical protein